VATHCTAADIKRIELNSQQSRNKLILRLLFETGCTVTELINLTWQDIKAGNCYFSKKRALPLSEGLKVELEKLRKQPTAHILQSRQKKTLTARRVQQILKICGKCINIHLTPHILRKSYVINSFLNNIPITLIEKRLGLNVQKYLYEYLKQ